MTTSPNNPLSLQNNTSQTSLKIVQLKTKDIRRIKTVVGTGTRHNKPASYSDPSPDSELI